MVTIRSRDPAQKRYVSGGAALWAWLVCAIRYGIQKILNRSAKGAMIATIRQLLLTFHLS
jgi:hypothetical protein